MEETLAELITRINAISEDSVCGWCGANQATTKLHRNNKERVIECVDELGCIYRCRFTINYRQYTPSIYRWYQ